MSQKQDQNDGSILSPEIKQQIKKPERYQVILLNDDYTPREFVVFVLQKVFQFNEDKAASIMAEAHHAGKASCGDYPRDVAETKVHDTAVMAKEYAYPLHFEMARAL